MVDQRPILERGGYTPELELAEGDPIELYGTFPSIGGAGVGLTLVVWGPAVEAGLLRLESGWIGRMTEAGHQRHEVTGFRAENNALVAHLPDAIIPEGMPLDSVVKSPQSQWRAVMAAMGRAQLGVRVSGEVCAAGDLEVYVGLIPTQNPDGHHNWTSRLKVSPPSRQPLRAAGAHPESVLAMMQPRTLFALAALPGPGEAGALMAEWHGKIAHLAEGAWSVGHWEAGGRFRAGTLTPKAIPRWKRWAGFVSQLESGGGLTARRPTGPWPEDGDPVFTTDGFSCGRARHRSGERPFFLALWVDLSTRPPELGDVLEPALIGLVDRAMAQGGLQAAVGRWRDHTDGLNPTAYERACGIMGQQVVSQHWCQRWLRAVTPTVWLGSALRAQVSGRPSAAAVEEPVGDAVRLSLRDGASLDDLEVELADILPGA